MGSVKQVMRFPSDSRKGRAYLAQAVHKVLVCGVPRMVKNLKRIENAWFPDSQFSRTAAGELEPIQQLRFVTAMVRDQEVGGSNRFAQD